MNKINVKDLIHDDTSFRLNRTRTLFKLEKLLAEHGISKRVPFILFVDDEDKASLKYVKHKLLDIEDTKIVGIPISFTSLYNIEGSIKDTELFTTLKWTFEKYNTSDIPFIVQIPSDTKKFKLFEDSGIYGLIMDSITLLKNKLGSIIETRALDADYFIDQTDISRYENEVRRLGGSALSDTETLDSILSESKLPATPKGILILINKLIPTLNLRRATKNFSGLKIAIVGCNSKTTGMYLSDILLKLKATTSLYHSKSIIDKDEFSEYDVVISCVGNSGFITSNEIGNSEFDRLFIDVGVSVNHEGKVKGDFKECIRTERNNYTPYINGVGLLTRAALLNNIMLSYRYILNKNKEVK